MEQQRWPAQGLKASCGVGVRNHEEACCATGVLLSLPEFGQPKPRLMEMIDEAGHICLFLPKVRVLHLTACVVNSCVVQFHCELAPIERVWSEMKRFCREHAGYNKAILAALISEVVAELKKTPDFIHKQFQRVYRFLRLYEDGACASCFALHYA